VYISCQKEDMPVLPPLAALLDPHGLAGTGADVSIAPRAAGGYGGARLTVRFADDEVSPEDRLSLKEDMELKLDIAERAGYTVAAVRYRGEPLARVVDGSIQSHHFVRAGNGSARPPFVVFELAAGCATETALLLMSRVLFSNLAAEVDAGPRTAVVALATARDLNVLTHRFAVEELDQPTELRIAHRTVAFRLSHHVPPRDAVRSAAFPAYVPVAYHATVYDSDTDRFGGGQIRVTLTNGAKGDGLAFVPDSGLINAAHGALGPSALSMTDAAEVVFEGRVVATLVRGRCIAQHGAELAFEHGDGAELEVYLTLAADDECSILAVQELLRHVVLYNNATFAAAKPQHPAATRDVAFDVIVGDGEQACQIDEAVKVAPYGALLQLTEKGCTHEYKEGGPPVRLGLLDYPVDRAHPVASFQGGHVFAAVAEGAEEDDLLALRDDGEFRLGDVGSGMKRVGRVRSASTRMDAVEKALQEGLRGSVACATTDGGAAFIGQVVRKEIPASELFVRDVKEAVGLVTWLSNRSAVLVQFYMDRPRADRRLAQAVMRALTFQCAGADPSVPHKVVRVQAADQPGATPSEVLFGVTMQLVDDVTQIVLAKARRRYVAGPHPQPLFPHGEARLEDDDTEFFDGGHLLVKGTGCARGDRLSVVFPPQQRRADAAAPTAALTVPHFPAGDLFYDDDAGTLHHKGVHVATITTVDKEGAQCDIKAAFVTAAGSDLLPIDLASYLLNSFCFANATDRPRASTRSYQVRIKDVDNPVDGKTKMTLDVTPPLASFAHHPGQHAFAQTLSVGDAAPARLAVGKSLHSAWEKCGAGGVTVTVRQPGAALLLDVAREKHLSVRDGGAVMWRDRDELGRVERAADGAELRLTFAAARGDKMSKAVLVSLLGSVYLVSTAADDGLPACTVEWALQDDATGAETRLQTHVVLDVAEMSRSGSPTGSTEPDALAPEATMASSQSAIM
jgi:hypothetical protein